MLNQNYLLWSSRFSEIMKETPLSICRVQWLPLRSHILPIHIYPLWGGGGSRIARKTGVPTPDITKCSAGLFVNQGNFQSVIFLLCISIVNMYTKIDWSCSYFTIGTLTIIRGAQTRGAHNHLCSHRDHHWPEHFITALYIENVVDASWEPFQR